MAKGEVNPVKIINIGNWNTFPPKFDMELGYGVKSG
jgi:hypothetical protein